MNVRRIIAIVMLTVCLLASSALAGTLTRIYICPGDMMLRSGMKQQFQVFGLDSDGNEVAVVGPVTWGSDPAAGAITSTGLFTAGTTTGMYRSGATASVPGGLSAISVIEIVAPSSSGGYALESSWGNFGPGHLSGAWSIAVGPTGSVYVSDFAGNRMQAFDSSGNYVTMWGSGGASSTTHYSWFVGGIATDSSGNVYEADESYNSVRKFSSSGTYLTSIGSYGTGDGRFQNPVDVAVDASGFIYALDSQLYRVQKFSPTGSFLLKWGSSGTGNSQFTDPRCIAVDTAGRICVTDSGANCVKIFGSNGSYITQWGIDGDGQFDSPVGIDVGPGGYVYVSDYDSSYDARIQKFDATGILITSWNVTASPLGPAPSPWKIATDASGNVYAADSQNNSVHKYTSTGQFVMSWGSQNNLRGQFNSPDRAVVDGSGNIYVLDRGTYSIQKFNAQRDSVARWGTYGTGNGQFTYPTSIALGPDNCIYVVDMSNCRISVFDSSGTFLRKWGARAWSVGKFWEPAGIAVGTDGIVYVCDRSRRVVLRFTSQGSFLSEWSYKVSGETDSYADEIAIDAQNRIFVADFCNHRIKKFDSLGNLIMQFGSYGYGPGQLVFVDDIAFGAGGSIYVADGNEIDIFDSAGTWVKQLGSFGTGPGEFAGVSGVALDSLGNVYALDDNNRIIKFVPQLSASDTAGTKTLPDGQFVSTIGQVVTAGSTELSDCFYMESPSRCAGIKVTGKSASRGTTASVDGILATVNGEREIKASSVSTASGTVVTPLGMSTAQVGGDALGLQGALLGWHYTGLGYDHVPMTSLNSVGLLVRVWGTVRSVNTVDRTFMITDGSALDLKCRVPAAVSLPPQGSLRSVTGISSTEGTAGSLLPVIRVRVSADIQPLD